MTKDEALKLALEALKLDKAWLETDAPKMARDKNNEAITAIKEALAQPEQEPVATLDDLEQEIYENTRQFVSCDVMEWMLKRYYTTPPQRKPLTDEEISSLWDGHTVPVFGEIGINPIVFARAIEAAHGIKGDA